MMGGDVTMISNQGRGSEFTLTVKGRRSESAQMMDDIEVLIDSAEPDFVQASPMSAERPPTNLEINTPADQIIEPTAMAKTELPQDLPPEYAPIQSVETVNIDILEETSPSISSDRMEAPIKNAIETPEARPDESYDAESLRGLKVLIVEDIPANHDVIKLFLDPEGCECLGALNGIEALNILKTQAVDILSLIHISEPTRPY